MQDFLGSLEIETDYRQNRKLKNLEVTDLLDCSKSELKELGFELSDALLILRKLQEEGRLDD